MKSNRNPAGTISRPVIKKDDFIAGRIASVTMSTGRKRVSASNGVRAKAKSDAFEAIHSAASGLRSVGAIDKTTMREFDAACLALPDLSAEDVRNIRIAVNVSQEVFARYLGTNKSTVQKWESAGNRPSPMAQKLLLAVKKHGLDVLS
jgi:putative transcriptional regulator